MKIKQYKLNIGKHKGKELKDIPLGYLNWAVHNLDFKKNIKDKVAIQNFLQNEDASIGSSPTKRNKANSTKEHNQKIRESK